MEEQVQDPTSADAQVTENDPRTISQVRLQLQIGNAIAALDLDEVESERLAGILCGKVNKWVREVYLIECSNHGVSAHRPPKV